MVDTVLKSRDERNRWAVHLRMEPRTFGWVIMKAGEQGLPISSYINKRLAELADLDLPRRAEDAPPCNAKIRIE